jgi:hypothetical protein
MESQEVTDKKISECGVTGRRKYGSRRGEGTDGVVDHGDHLLAIQQGDGKATRWRR